MCEVRFHCSSNGAAYNSIGAARFENNMTMATRRGSSCTRRFVFLLVLLLTLPAMVQAQFTFITNSGTITITGYTGSGAAVTIPGATNGLPVVGIGTNAFYLCTNLISVTIPPGVTNIGDRAFQACYNLTSVTIPDNVTSVGDQVFESCVSLPNAVIPNSVVSVGSGAFANCANLASVTIGLNVTNIGNLAFISCYRLTNVTIPNSVTTIGDSAFDSCYRVTSVTIGNGVTNIGNWAFEACGMTNVTIPDSVASIGISAFDVCPNLTAITVDALNSVYSSVDGVLFNKSQTTLVRFPGGRNGSYVIPNSVKNIGITSFDWCLNLTSVMIPNSVTNIGTSAFDYCTSLTNITIPGSVISLEGWAFSFCTGLKDVYFMGNAPLAGAGALYSDINATVYYLAGTTGWDSTFGGRPTALWLLPNPIILYNGPGFGVDTNGFGFIISWATNLSVVVEASTNLAGPFWSPIATNILTGGSSYFSDPQWTNYRARFYRLRSP
jgi:BspA type Leucine rich repeat region (6 copies)